GTIAVNSGGTFRFAGGTANYAAFNLNDGGTVVAGSAVAPQNETIGTLSSPGGASAFTQGGTPGVNGTSTHTVYGALVLGADGLTYSTSTSTSTTSSYLSGNGAAGGNLPSEATSSAAGGG